MELEMNLARDQESAQQVHAPLVSLSPSIKTNLNNSNARPVHVQVTARNSDAVTVKVTPSSQSSNGGTRCEPRSCPPPVAPKPHTTTTPPCISSTNQISPSAERNAKQTSSIISSRPRETNLGRSESKRVQFKEVLEENIPVRGRAAEKEPIASPPNSPLKPILNTSPQSSVPPPSPHPASTFSPVSSPPQPPHSASNTFHSTFSPHTTNINTTHQPASGGLTNAARQPRALPVTPPQSNGYGHLQQAAPQQAPSRQANSSFLAELNSALKPKPGGLSGKPPVSPRPPLSPKPKPHRQENTPHQNTSRQGVPSSPMAKHNSPQDSTSTFSSTPRLQSFCKQGSPTPPRVQYPPSSPVVPPKVSNAPTNKPPSPRVRNSPPSSPASQGAIFVLPPSPNTQLKRASMVGNQVKRSGSNRGAKPPPLPRRDGGTQLSSGSLEKKLPPPPPPRTT